MKPLKWLGVGAAVLVGLVLIVFAVGALLPRNHTAIASVELDSAAEEVWALISDIEGTAAWRPGVESVTRIDDRDGRAAYEEINEFGAIRYVVERQDPPHTLITRIIDNDDFGGTWTYRIEPASGGCRLAITEDGEIMNLMFRFLTYFVFGYEQTMQGYLQAVSEQLSNAGA